MKRVLLFIEYAITIALIGTAAFAVVEYASGTQPFYVISDNPSSMSPTINYGWLVLVYKAPFGSIHPGDIIAFHDPRGDPGIIIHRVVSVESCGGQMCVQTKGDNNATNPTNDPWNVTERSYLSQVIFVVPYAGYLSPALWHFDGLLALLPLAFVALLIVYFGNVRAATNNKKREEARMKKKKKDEAID